jgi:hypothetical protein
MEKGMFVASPWLTTAPKTQNRELADHPRIAACIWFSGFLGRAAKAVAIVAIGSGAGYAVLAGHGPVRLDDRLTQHFLLRYSTFVACQIMR